MPEHAATQTIGSYVSYVNTERLDDCANEAIKILEVGKTKLQQQDINLSKALKSVDKAFDFLGKPENILGRSDTKHGEIAESIQVNISNAKEYLYGLVSSHSFEGVGRTAPEDYLVNETNVQSKFIAGTNGSLDHVINHMDKYPSFGRDGSYYHIPKDQYEDLVKVRNGEQIDYFAEKTIRALRRKMEEIEIKSGHRFEDVVKPGISKYSEVQQAVAHDTVSNHKNEILKENISIKENIRNDTSSKLQNNTIAHGPSFTEGAKVAGVGAIVGGGLKAGMAVYFKCKKDNKKISDFTPDDWKDIGVNFGSGAVQGGVSGSSLYLLTNYTSLSAPLASSFVSAACGIAKIGHSYSTGEISADEFIEQSQIVCFDAAAVGLGAAAGQAIIPIPVIGALVGSLAAKYGVELWKQTLGKQSEELSRKLNEFHNSILIKFDIVFQKYISKIHKYFEKLDLFINNAFNFSLNAQFRFENSIKLATCVGVPEAKILKSVDEVDGFFLN